MPEIYVFGGAMRSIWPFSERHWSRMRPHGSGKTTLATTILSATDNQIEFVNADIIAAELNPDRVDTVAIQASRLMLERINTLSRQKTDFARQCGLGGFPQWATVEGAFETTLAARSFARFLRKCKAQGYRINLVYVWLESAELAINRVARRVASGGHNIPEDIIRRRYERGKKNFVELYLPIVDCLQVYNNSGYSNSLVAYRSASEPKITIIEIDTWNQITNY